MSSREYRALKILRTDRRFLVMIDSFKGTLSSADAVAAVCKGLATVFDPKNIVGYPIADGGEGSSQIAGEIVNAERISCEVCGPLGETISSFYYRTKSRAFIEFAAASGYAQLGDRTAITARAATSYGVGQLISHAVSGGALDITLFLGGSSTTDAGIGMIKALGGEFYDSRGNRLPHPDGLKVYPGEQLEKVADYDLTALKESLRGVEIQAAVDVTNPLCGERGAAQIFGPQKGLNMNGVRELDAALMKLGKLWLKKEASTQFGPNAPGAGAAGGAGFAIGAFLDGKLISGSDFFLDLIEFEKCAEKADFIITGEGRIDHQSNSGKILSAVVSRSRALNKPVVAIGGVLGLGSECSGAICFGLGHENGYADPANALCQLATQIATLISTSSDKG